MSPDLERVKKTQPTFVLSCVAARAEASFLGCPSHVQVPIIALTATATSQVGTGVAGRALLRAHGKYLLAAIPGRVCGGACIGDIKICETTGWQVVRVTSGKQALAAPTRCAWLCIGVRRREVHPAHPACRDLQAQHQPPQPVLRGRLQLFTRGERLSRFTDEGVG